MATEYPQVTVGRGGPQMVHNPPAPDRSPTRSIRVRDADWKRFRMAALAADQTVAQFLVTLLDAHESRPA